jgi:hypothetical protein
MISRDKVRHALTGSILSLNTLFHMDGSIDYPSICRIVDVLPLPHDPDMARREHIELSIQPPAGETH